MSNVMVQYQPKGTSKRIGLVGAFTGNIIEEKVRLMLDVTRIILQIVKQ